MRPKLVSFWFLVSFVVLVLLLVAVARAECHFVWHKGDVTYKPPGHLVHFIVNAEDISAYRHQVQIDDSLLPGPSDNNFEETIQNMAHIHRCNDYRELTDDDVYKIN